MKANTVKITIKNLAVLMLGAGLVMSTGCGADRKAAAKAPAKTTADKSATGANGDSKAVAGQVRTLSDTPFERAWDLQLPKPILYSWVLPGLPDLIFFQVKETYEIYAVECGSGNTRWVTPPFPRRARLAPFASHVDVRNAKGDAGGADDRLWVISDDTLYSFDAIYGQVVWRWTLPFSPSTPPLALGPDGNQRIFIGDWEGRMQVVTYHGEKRFPYVLWQMNIRNSVTAAPVETDGLVYAADQKGVLHCFKYDREQVWQYDTNSPINGSPLVRGRVLFAGNDDNVLFSINRLSGQRLGSLYLNGPIKRAPFAFKAEPSRVYAWVDASTESGLQAVKSINDNVPYTDSAKNPLEVERLAKEWFVPGVSRLVASDPDHLFVTEPKSFVVKAVSRASGHIDWTWDTAEEHLNYHNAKGKIERRTISHLAEYQDATDSNRSLFTVDDTGHVIAYRVFGDKPNDPTTGGRFAAAAAIAAPAKTEAKPAPDKTVEPAK